MLKGRIDELTSHGYTIEYAIPAEAFKGGYVRASQVTAYASEDDRPFVRIPSACSDDRTGTTSYISQSNFRSLERDFGRAVVRISFTFNDGLGIFVHSASDILIAALLALADYAVYDESDLSFLEADEITSSWDSYLYADLYRQLPQWARDLADTHDDTEIRSAFHDAMLDGDYYPEAANGEILWDYQRCRQFLITALRRLKRIELGRPVAAYRWCNG